jgi:cinnamyl-alcohol dehydrogenase
MAPTVAAEAAAAAAGKQQHTGKAAALAARDASGHLAPLTITRRYVCSCPAASLPDRRRPYV